MTSAWWRNILTSCAMTAAAFLQIDEDTDRDRYMSPLEAKEYGLIDHIIGGDDAGFKVRNATLNYYPHAAVDLAVPLLES